MERCGSGSDWITLRFWFTSSNWISLILSSWLVASDRKWHHSPAPLRLYVTCWGGVRTPRRVTAAVGDQREAWLTCLHTRSKVICLWQSWTVSGLWSSRCSGDGSDLLFWKYTGDLTDTMLVFLLPGDAEVIKVIKVTWRSCLFTLSSQRTVCLCGGTSAAGGVSVTFSHQPRRLILMIQPARLLTRPAAPFRSVGAGQETSCCSPSDGESGAGNVWPC